MRPEQEWIECWACGGSGDDDVNWDGLCTYCGGNGERLVDVRDADDDRDDDWLDGNGEP